MVVSQLRGDGDRPRHVKPQFIVNTSAFGHGKDTISSFTGVIRQISLLPVHRTMLAVLDQSLCTKLC